MFPDMDESRILNAIPLQGVMHAVEELRGIGIELSASGQIAEGAEFPLVRGVMGVIVKALAKREREGMMTRLAEVGRSAGGTPAQKDALRSMARLRSCCGGASGWVEAVPGRFILRLRDAEFLSGMRWRLGLPVLRQGRCQLCPGMCAGNSPVAEDKCGISLDVYGDHALSCKKGGGCVRVHGSVAKVLGEAARESGAECQYEVVVPELLKGTPGAEHAVEAILDIHVWCAHPWPCELWIDVTQRHPWAKRYQSRAPHENGVAAKKGEGDKRERYGEGSDGVTVTTAALETWGHMAEGFQQVLGTLEALWAERTCANPDGTARIARRWREEIGMAQVRSFHRTVELATRGRGSDTVSDVESECA